MDDAVARFRAASEANDIESLVAALAPDAELVSPLSRRMVFRGREDLRVLFAAIYGSLREVRWYDEVGDGRARVVLGRAFVGPLRLDDAMVVELDDDGCIRCIRPHLRPWLALTAFALQLGPKLVRNFAVVRRALRA